MIKLTDILHEVVSKNNVQENAVTDLFKSIRTYGFKNAILKNAGPPLGTALFNGFKAGAIYKPDKDGNALYNKDVPWYAPAKVPSLAKQLDSAERVYEKAWKNLMVVKSKLAKDLSTVDVEKVKSGDGKSQITKTPEVISNHEDFLKANRDVLQAEGNKLYLMNQLQLAMGAKDKQNPKGLEAPIYDEKGMPVGVSYKKEDLYKRYPKDWVDDAFTDKPLPMDTRFKNLQIMIASLNKQIETGEKLSPEEEKALIKQYFTPQK
jgi:hypothetical protein